MKFDPLYVDQQKDLHKVHWSKRIDGYTEEFRYENNKYCDYFRVIPYKTVKHVLDSENVGLSNRKVLIAGCGNGADIYFLRKYYNADFFVVDISQDAIDLTMRLNENIKGQTEDLEKISFDNDSFDYSFSIHTIHHLPRPFLGIYELLRVSRYGVILVEPNDSFLPRLATKLGLIKEFEDDCKNYVFRISKHDIEKICKACQCKVSVKRVFAIHRVAKNHLEFIILKALNFISNLLIPFWSNYIIIYIEKRKMT